MAQFDGPYLRRLLAYLVGISSLVVLLAIFSGSFTFADVLNLFDSPLLLYAVLLQTVSIFVAGFGWVAMAMEETAISMREKIKVVSTHSISWAARYIPGYVAQLTGKVLGLNDLGVSVRKVSQLLFLEFVYMGLSAASMGLLFFATWIFLSESSFWLATLTIALAAAITFLYFSKYLKPSIVRFLSLASFLRDHLVDKGYPGKRVPIFYSASRFFSVVSYALVASTIANQTQDVILFASVAMISGLAGQLVPLVPSGIGVREWAGVAMLSFLSFSLDPAIMFMLISRFIMLISDLIALVFGIFIYVVSSERPS